jgi:hypothetical protein
MMGVGSKMRSMAIPSTVLNRAKDSDTSSHGTLGAIYQNGRISRQHSFLFIGMKRPRLILFRRNVSFIFFMYFGWRGFQFSSVLIGGWIFGNVSFGLWDGSSFLCSGMGCSEGFGSSESIRGRGMKFLMCTLFLTCFQTLWSLTVRKWNGCGVRGASNTESPVTFFSRAPGIRVRPITAHLPPCVDRSSAWRPATQ